MADNNNESDKSKSRNMAEDGLQPLSNTDFENIRNKMINRLIKTDAHFKHQQRGEPDLTDEEKSNIALDILNKSPMLFLERFSMYLTIEDIRFFNNQQGDYLVDFYIEEISKRSINCPQKLVKNRRFRAMQKLMDEGEYFSENEMKWREPLLYEQMVGQYISESEKENQMEQDIDKSDLRLSSILLKHMDIQANKQFFEMQKEKEEEQEEEDESEDDDSDEEDEPLKKTQVDSGIIKDSKDDADGDADSDTFDIERQYFHGEFLRTMQEKFLSGEDTNFDYSKVDNNTDYDSLDIVGYDAEEKYFDADEDDNCNSVYRKETQLLTSLDGDSRDIHENRETENNCLPKGGQWTPG